MNINVQQYISFLKINEYMKFSLIILLQLTDEDINELLNSMVCDNIITEVTDLFVYI